MCVSLKRAIHTQSLCLWDGVNTLAMSPLASLDPTQIGDGQISVVVWHHSWGCITKFTKSRKKKNRLWSTCRAAYSESFFAAKRKNHHSNPDLAQSRTAWPRKFAFHTRFTIQLWICIGNFANDECTRPEKWRSSRESCSKKIGKEHQSSKQNITGLA